MTVLWAAAVIGAILLVVGLTVVALRTRRAGHPGSTRIRLLAHEPEITRWLIPILDTVTGEGSEPWSYEVYPLPTAAGGVDLRAELRNPRRDAVITVAITSPQPMGESSVGDSTSVVVTLADQAQVSGPRRLIEVLVPRPSERRRRRLVALINGQGMTPPKGGELTRSRRLALIASIVAIAALVGVLAMAVELGPAAAPEPLLPSTPSPASRSTPPPVVVKGTKPKEAEPCPRVHSLGEATPTHSAVNARTTSCPFAEEVRYAYIDRGGSGRDITLTKVFSPVTTKRYTMRCRGANTVKCTGGDNAVVYLY